MRILILGGTWFLGSALVSHAMRRGWSVTTFNRGRSGVDAPGVQAVHGDRTVAADLKCLAGHGPWDAVIDTSSSELPPRDVLLAAEILRPKAARWVHVSTVSVYSGWPHEWLTEDSPVLECPAGADDSFGITGEDGSPTKYGFQKAGGEAAIRQTFRADAAILRPGVILGPGEYVGRLPWWLTRAQRGGPMLAPAPSDRVMQPVDVRDVAPFALEQATADKAGVFNIAHPQGISWAGFLAACLDTTSGAGHPVWVDPDKLSASGVKQWTELPLWRTHSGVWSVDASRAMTAGLRCRPVERTIADTWTWLQSSGGHRVKHPRWNEHGIDPEKESKILAALGHK